MSSLWFCSKLPLLQKFSLCLITTTLTLPPSGIQSVEEIAIARTSPRPPIALSGQVAQLSDAAEKAEADRLLEQGLQQYKNSQFPAALQSAENALQIYRGLKNRPGEGTALVILGGTFSALGNYTQAIALLQQGLTILQEVKSRQFEQIALVSLGEAWLKQGTQQYQAHQFLAALQSAETALQTYRESENRLGEGAALVLLGGTYSALGDYTQAIAFLQQGLTLAQAIKNRPLAELAIGPLGEAWAKQGTQQFQARQLPEAVQSFEKALQIYRELKNRIGEGVALALLGRTYASLDDYAKAIALLQQGLAIAEETNTRQLAVIALGGLGVVYNNLGNSAKAIELHHQSLAIAREVKDRAGEGQALNNLGLVYFFLRNYPKAIESHGQSLAIAREIKDRLSERASLLNLGNAYSALADYAKAIEYYEQCLTLSQELKDRLGEGTALGGLGFAYFTQGDLTKAAAYNQQSLVISQEINDRPGEWKALYRIGLVLAKSGRAAEAEPILRAAIRVLESLRQGLSDLDKVSVADAQSDPYKMLQVVLLDQNKEEAALEISERSRARAFREQLAKRLQSTEYLASSAVQITTIKQIAQNQNATLVQYSQIYDQQLFIWVIKPNGEIAFRRVDLSSLKQQNTSLAKLVAAARCLGRIRCETLVASNRGRAGIAVVENPTQADRQENSPQHHRPQLLYLQELHKLLIAPISDLLPTDPNAHVIFVPQGSLLLVPFAALQDTQGKYLVQQHTIAIAPSIQVLELTHKQRQQLQPVDRHALVVGNPQMPLQLPQLPGAQQEAEAIADLLQTQAIVGAQATKAAIVQKMPTARWIHLATHGILDDQHGLSSAIALAPNGTGERTDGLLTADEILNLKLSAELVVLSACDSGGGRITGDGVIGLSRSLITAGVPSVLVSLWAVPDAPTALLMQSFYQQLQSNPDKAQALRQAMLHTLKEYPDPEAWAAFILIGEAK